MMRLTRVELRRLFSGPFLQATPVSAEEQAATRVVFEEQQKDWQANGARYVQDCRDMQ